MSDKHDYCPGDAVLKQLTNLSGSGAEIDAQAQAFAEAVKAIEHRGVGEALRAVEKEHRLGSALLGAGDTAALAALTEQVRRAGTIGIPDAAFEFGRSPAELGMSDTFMRTAAAVDATIGRGIGSMSGAALAEALRANDVAQFSKLAAEHDASFVSLLDKIQMSGRAIAESLKPAHRTAELFSGKLDPSWLEGVGTYAREFDAIPQLVNTFDKHLETLSLTRSEMDALAIGGHIDAVSKGLNDQLVDLATARDRAFAAMDAYGDLGRLAMPRVWTDWPALSVLTQADLVRGLLGDPRRRRRQEERRGRAIGNDVFAQVLNLLDEERNREDLRSSRRQLRSRDPRAYQFYAVSIRDLVKDVISKAVASLDREYKEWREQHEDEESPWATKFRFMASACPCPEFEEYAALDWRVVKKTFKLVNDWAHRDSKSLPTEEVLQASARRFEVWLLGVLSFLKHRLAN